MKAWACWLCLWALGCATTHGAEGERVGSGSSAESTRSARSLQSAIVGVAHAVSGSVVALRVQRGMGSGVVIRSDGYVLTNGHVVRGASRLEVVFQDGRRLTGQIVGVDAATDLAVVKVEAKGLPAARFADSHKVEPGQWVVAIGSPFGLDYSVTVGVVSAVGRGGVGMNEIEDYLQTDASINPGNSGGPLVNLDGEVIGINTMIVGNGAGIGFAIPSSLARNVAEQFIEKGSVHRAYLGVAFQELTPELAEQFGVQGRGGALVSSVEPAGPAELAGLLPGDVIVSVDGRAIAESRDLLRTVLEKQIGATLQLSVVRDGIERRMSVVTVERPGDARASGGRGAARRNDSPLGLGLRLALLTPDVARALGHEGVQGVAVADVDDGSAAQRAGLARGDVIVEVDRKPVQAPADVDAALADGSALLRVARRGAFRYALLHRSE